MMPSKSIIKKSSGKKTTITLPTDLFETLEQFARERKKTVAELVLEAVRDRYRMHSKTDKLKIIAEMKKADFPFWTWQELEKDYEESFFE